MDTADAQLVARARAGDEDAFRALVGRHHDRVYRTTYAVTADPHDAAEAAQDAWVKAWGSLRGYRGEAALATWLTRLALNAATDVLRRRRRRERLAALTALVPWSKPATDRIEDRDELRAALARLRPEARRLMALRHGLGLSVDEIADALGCPAGTVKSRLHAATVQLRKGLHRDGAAPAPQPVERGQGAPTAQAALDAAGTEERA